MQDKVYSRQHVLCNCQPTSSLPVSCVWLFLSFDNASELSESSLIQVTYSSVCVIYFSSHSKDITVWYFPSFPKMNSGTPVIIQSRFTYFIQQCKDRVSGLVLVLVFRFHTLSFLHNLWDLLSKFSFLNCKWKDIKSKICHCPFRATRNPSCI